MGTHPSVAAAPRERRASGSSTSVTELAATTTRRSCPRSFSRAASLEALARAQGAWRRSSDPALPPLQLQHVHVCVSAAAVVGLGACTSPWWPQWVRVTRAGTLAVRRARLACCATAVRVLVSEAVSACTGGMSLPPVAACARDAPSVRCNLGCGNVGGVLGAMAVRGVTSGCTRASPCGGRRGALRCSDKCVARLRTRTRTAVLPAVRRLRRSPPRRAAGGGGA